MKKPIAILPYEYIFEQKCHFDRAGAERVARKRNLIHYAKFAVQIV
jgi:hypothetical protein